MIDLGSALNSNTMVSNLKDSASKKMGGAKGKSKSDVDTQSKIPDSKFADKLNEKKIASDASQDSRPADEITKDSAEINSKESAPRQSGHIIDDKKPATRQAAMEIFLDRMKNDLGVEPEEVLSAFSTLSLSDMIAPPEDSADAVISKLNLSEADSQKALGLYNEMLAMTAAAGMAQYLNNKGQQADFHVLNQKEASLQELRKSLDDMSDKFFVTGPNMAGKTGFDQQAKIAKAYAAQMQMNGGDVAIADQPIVSDDASKKSKLDVSGMMPVGAEEVVPVNVNQAPVLNTIPNTNVPKTVLETFKDMSAEASAEDSALTVDPLQPELKGIEATTTGAAPADAPTTNSIFSAAGAKLNSDTSKEQDKDSEADKNLDTQNVGSSTTDIHKTNLQKSFNINAPKANAADVQTNVKEIISQAQFLAKKGGGEMSVSLNPEGMGEVNLKVKMVNGQVNVEMVTSSDEAKKVLEKGLSELKDSLATHKLHLDSIRIDSSKDISQHMDQQQKDNERGFQQRFLSDFQDRNTGLKRDMYEFGAPSVPKSQTRDDAANAIYDPSRKRRPDESRRLDLVA